jgi:hypothetical protein
MADPEGWYQAGRRRTSRRPLHKAEPYSGEERVSPSRSRHVAVRHLFVTERGTERRYLYIEMKDGFILLSLPLENYTHDVSQDSGLHARIVVEPHLLQATLAKTGQFDDVYHLMHYLQRSRSVYAPSNATYAISPDLVAYLLEKQETGFGEHIILS